MRWDLGIDLGTENIRMAAAGRGVILGAPALLTLREGSESPFAAGEAAHALLGRTCEGMRVVAPLRDGVLENNMYAEKLLRWAIQQQESGKKARRPAVLITHAPHARPVQQEALMRSAIEAGAGEASLIRSDVAAALGTGMDILAPEAKMIVDVGAGSMTATLFTLGRMAATATLPFGLDRIDETIIRMLRTEEGFLIGARTAAELKQTLGSALPSAAEGVPMQAAGINIKERIPEMRAVSPELVWRACDGLVRELITMCASVMENAPEELAADLNDAGVMLVGGGARLSGLDKRIGDAFGVPCSIAEAPEACAAKGMEEYIDNTARYEKVLEWALEKVVRR